MANVHDSYFGVAEETSYGTGSPVDRFFEMSSESFTGDYQRIDSEAFRAGQRVLHADRFVPNPKGATGSIELEVRDGDFGLLFAHMLGAVSSGSPSGSSPSITTHTFTMADLDGKSLTVQVGRVANDGQVHPWTYEGGKITSWELSNSVDGILMLSLDMDFARETIGAQGSPGTLYGVASPTYSSGTQLFTFRTAEVTIGGSTIPVSEVSFSGDNGLNTDRWVLGAQKREPKHQGLRTFGFSVTGEFESLTQAERVAAAIASDAVASVSAKWTTAQGGELSISIPYARFDSGPVNFSGAELIGQQLEGIALWNGSNSPITLVYKSVDSTP